MMRRSSNVIATSLLILAWGGSGVPADERDDSFAAPAAVVRELLNDACLDCHSGSKPTAGLDLESIAAIPIEPNRHVWEKVVRKLRTRQMPPADAPRPDETTYNVVVKSLASQLDALAARHPRPGRTETFRRLTRTEYQNSIRDLLALEIDVTDLLPPDESSQGFDNITVGELSPTLLSRYVSAAQKISRLAIGGAQNSPGGETIRLRPDITQEERIAGLPLGTRGGVLFSHHFPRDGEYEFQIRLARDRDEHVEGLSEPHELELLVDFASVASFTVKPPKGNGKWADGYGKPSHDQVDQHLKTRVKMSAGPHEVGVAFLKLPSSLLETARQPLNVHFNMYRHPRLGPAVYQVSITGPYDPAGPGDTPSRQRIFEYGKRDGLENPSTVPADDEEASARQIVAALLRRACRRPIREADLIQPMQLFREARAEGTFDDGIEMALSSVLLHPEFLFRIEREPEGIASRTPYAIGDLELASRLSFFLWSSLPDDELLDLAERGKLSDPEVLEQQTRRMLGDDRSRALVTNFAGMWLHLRNLEAITPDGRLFPDFDDNLRQAFREETERFFESILREDRSVLELLQSDYTFLNERLAKHYGIPHVYGSRFRRVSLDATSRRGGLLRHGSILTVTSYATRTSPVIRGKWILENLMGTPPPPPPDDVPALQDNTVAANLSVRERLAQHRANAACASCHNLIDPIGFSLENFDAVGRWRDTEEGKAIDASGGLPDGSQFTGVSGLEQGLLERPEIFVSTLTEKLLTYAMGRGVEPFDAPAVRKIVSDAERDSFRFSSIILGIVRSIPFQMRESS